jgi:hypothetical protein
MIWPDCSASSKSDLIGGDEACESKNDAKGAAAKRPACNWLKKCLSGFCMSGTVAAKMNVKSEYT